MVIVSEKVSKTKIVTVRDWTVTERERGSDLYSDDTERDSDRAESRESDIDKEDEC